MKSSKDIEPRVGMQVVFSNHKRVERIVKVDNRLSFMCGKITLDSGNTAYSWEHGSFSIEWIPPTDEERKLFAKYADNHHANYDPVSHAKNGPFDCFSVGECFGIGLEDQSQIMYSLALDGADYDNMPEGFE